MSLIEFNDSVEAKSIEKLIEDIKDFQMQGLGVPIELNITTRGGCLASAMVFTNWVKANRIPLVTVAIDMVASAGVMLWSCGRLRRMEDDATLLIHQPRVITHQPILMDDILKKKHIKNPYYKRFSRKEAEYVKNQYFYTIAENLGIDPEWLKRKTGEKDWCIGKAEAEKRGWC